MRERKGYTLVKYTTHDEDKELEINQELRAHITIKNGKDYLSI